jgi:membrane dipeptidase
MDIADLHCDTAARLYERHKAGDTTENLYANKGHNDLLKMRAGHYIVQNFALFVDAGAVERPFAEAKGMYQYFMKQLKEFSRYIRQVTTYEQIMENKKEGRISALLTIEEGSICQGSIRKLHQFYKAGVRMMTLTWNYENELAHPALKSAFMGEREIDFDYRTPDLTHGLKKKGLEFVQEMERLGIIIDVSHLSDRGIYDVLAHTSKPIVASHSNARALSPWVRNLTDDMIRKIGERGGLVGLNFCPDFLKEVPLHAPNPGRRSDVARHARHIADVGGIDIVALGSDFDGIKGNAQLKNAASVISLYDDFKREGFTEDEIGKIFSGNVMRLYREML